MTTVVHWPNGNLKYIEVRNGDNVIHNPNGPAVQSWYKNGQEQHRYYWVDGKRHNPNGPADQRWYENGRERSRCYWVGDKQHNPNGPAYQEWFENGKEEDREYWVDDKLLTGTEFKAFQDSVEVTCGDKTVRISKTQAVKLGLIDKPKTTRRRKCPTPPSFSILLNAVDALK